MMPKSLQNHMNHKQITWLVVSANHRAQEPAGKRGLNGSKGAWVLGNSASCWHFNGVPIFHCKNCPYVLSKWFHWILYFLKHVMQKAEEIMFRSNLNKLIIISFFKNLNVGFFNSVEKLWFDTL